MERFKLQTTNSKWSWGLNLAGAGAEAEAKLHCLHLLTWNNHSIFKLRWIQSIRQLNTNLLCTVFSVLVTVIIGIRMRKFHIIISINVGCGKPAIHQLQSFDFVLTQSFQFCIYFALDVPKCKPNRNHKHSKFKLSFSFLFPNQTYRSCKITTLSRPLPSHASICLQSSHNFSRVIVDMHDSRSNNL